MDYIEKVKISEKKKRFKWDFKMHAYIFLAPFFLTFIIFGLFPIVYTLYLSFTKYDGFADPTFVGASNYTKVVTDPIFYQSLKNTVIMWLMGAIPQFIFAFLLAAIFSYCDIKRKKVFRAIYYLPRLVTAVSISALFTQFLNYPSGIINKLLLDLNIISEPINFLNNVLFAQGTVGFIHWWMYFGNTMIMVMAGMAAISPSLYEAAKIDGANFWTTFWYITFPLLKPITLFVFLNSLIGGLQSFDVQQVLTGGLGAPQGKLMTVVMYLYNTAFTYNNYGYAAAIAYYLFIFIALASLLIFVNNLRGGKNKL